ncbi:MAG: histone deacetylase, partial [Candidatus Margulisiibacteriota bacterium]
QLGSLQLTMVGLKKRDKFVIEEAKKLNIPIAIVLGGGYAAKLEDTVTIHTNTIKVALSKVND